MALMQKVFAINYFSDNMLSHISILGEVKGIHPLCYPVIPLCWSVIILCCGPSDVDRNTSLQSKVKKFTIQTQKVELALCGL